MSLVHVSRWIYIFFVKLFVLVMYHVRMVEFCACVSTIEDRGLIPFTRVCVSLG